MYSNIYSIYDNIYNEIKKYDILLSSNQIYGINYDTFKVNNKEYILTGFMNYEINKMDNDRHHDSRANENSFICTSCFKSNSFSYIYKCLICPVELCGDCYEKKYETELQIIKL